MELNLVVLAGRLAAPPEIRRLESDVRMARYLVTVRADRPERRLDVIPVTLWDPLASVAEEAPPPGTPVWMVGTLQRRFWSGADGRRSRLEVVASHLEFRPESAAEASVSEPGSGSAEKEGSSGAN